MPGTAETTDYDPRYDRGQTVAGAKARYVDPDLDYDEQNLERDVARVLAEGDYPDRDDSSGLRALDEPLLGGTTVYK
jgi:formyltetrahydrofolate hydrolase